MKKITKSQYIKALKTVDTYIRQVENKSKKCTVNLFGFLWHNFNYVEHQTFIKAKNIDSACKIFNKRMPKTMFRLDYEVQHGNEFIDISDRKEFKNICG